MDEEKSGRLRKSMADQLGHLFAIGRIAADTRSAPILRRTAREVGQSLGPRFRTYRILNKFYECV